MRGKRKTIGRDTRGCDVKTIGFEEIWKSFYDRGRMHTTAPNIGGTAAPPLTPATISPEPRFVWRPIPLMPKATMVGKQTLSKKRVRESMAMPVFWRCVIEAELKTMTRVR